MKLSCVPAPKVQKTKKKKDTKAKVVIQQDCPVSAEDVAGRHGYMLSICVVYVDSMCYIC